VRQTASPAAPWELMKRVATMARIPAAPRPWAALPTAPRSPEMAGRRRPGNPQRHCAPQPKGSAVPRGARPPRGAPSATPTLARPRTSLGSAARWSLSAAVGAGGSTSAAQAHRSPSPRTPIGQPAGGRKDGSAPKGPADPRVRHGHGVSAFARRRARRRQRLQAGKVAGWRLPRL
jgi:hypothetical protein